MTDEEMKGINLDLVKACIEHKVGAPVKNVRIAEKGTNCTKYLYDTSYREDISITYADNWECY